MTVTDDPCPVLVVEDDADIRESLVEILGEQGFAVIGAEHGRGPHGHHQRGERPPCVILLDLMMPVMDGFAFRARQRAEPRHAAVPVVVMSAYTGAQQKGAELEPAAILAKPIHLSTLIEVLDRFCARRDAAR